MLLDVWKKRETLARRGVRIIVDAMTRKRRPVRDAKVPKEANYVKDTYYDTLIDSTKVAGGRTKSESVQGRGESNGPSLRSKRETCKRINYTEPKDEECLIERRKGKPPLYKVIDKSMSYTKQNHTGRDRFPGRPKPKVLSNLVAKIRKRRKTALSVLSDEADNFMFPRTTTRADNTEDSDSVDLDSKIEMLNHEMGESPGQHTKDAPPNGLRPNRRKKNHVDSYLDANSDYGKFSPTASRILGQDAVEPMAEVVDVKPRTLVMPNLTRIINKEEIVRHRFAFERVPTTEPWYDAFLRQDEGREKVFEYYGSTAYRKLPFEMGPLPPLPQNCCSLTASNSKTTSTSTKTSATDSKEDPKKVSCPSSKATGSSSSSEALSKVMNKKRRQLLDIEYPRKSPREHASTLAILSCLVQQRKKEESASESEKNGGCSDESDTQREKKRTKTASPKRERRDYINVAQLNREIEELLSDPGNESFESVDVNVLENEELFAPLNTLPDFVSLVGSVEDEGVVGGGKEQTGSESQMKNTKKRKNNRTGWPKCKKNRGVRKSTNSETVVNVKSEDLCVGNNVVNATSPDSEIFTVSSSTESLQSGLSDLDGKTATKDSDTLSFSAKSCFISDDPEEINGTNSSDKEDVRKSPSPERTKIKVEDEEERRLTRRNFYQPVIALNRLDTQLVYNSYSLRSSVVTNKAKGGKCRRNEKGQYLKALSLSPKKKKNTYR